MDSIHIPGQSEPSFTFEQIEAGCAILRRYGSAVVAEYNEGGEVYELDYLKQIAEVLAPRRVMR